MNCEEVQIVLIDYLDNNLNGSNLSEIETHLSNCEKCRDEATEYQTIMQIISNSMVKIPDKSLKENFKVMLQSEITKLEISEINTKTRTLFSNLPSVLIKVAAGIAILISGILIGKYLKSDNYNQNQNTELTDLRNEIREMKKMLMFTMLNEESASQRIAAVNIVDDIPNPDQKILSTLFKTLNTDNNVNVRLAAAYSLGKFSESTIVRDSLIESLNKQKDPIIQIVLINILVEKKDVKAIKPLQKIIIDKNTIKEVKEIARQGMKVLL